MFQKMNITAIIGDHYKTFRRRDYAAFILLPLILGIPAYYLFGTITHDYASALLAAFSIFASLLLNLEVIVFGYLDRIKASVHRAKDSRDQYEVATSNRRYNLLYEIFCNISYLILVSIIEIIVVTLSYVRHMDRFCSSQVYDALTTMHGILVHIVAVHFILTLLMILKRVHVLLKGEARASGSETTNNDDTAT